MGKPIEQALGEVDFCAAIYEYYADNAAKLLTDEPIELLGRRGLGVHPAQLARRAARDHAVELPLLPGGPLRRPEPDHRQHDPAQARAAVPGVGGGDAADLPRRRLPRGRLRQHLRDQRSDRDGDRRPARAGRVADRLRAGRCRRRRDRRPQPEEGRARAGRLGPVHPAQHRRPRRDRRVRGRTPASTTPASPATRPSGSSSSTSCTSRSWRSSPPRIGAVEAGRPDVDGHRRSARCRRRRRPTGSRIRSSARSRTAPRSSSAASATATSSRRRC